MLAQGNECERWCDRWPGPSAPDSRAGADEHEQPRLGQPAYMAPEQVWRGRARPRRHLALAIVATKW